MYLARRKANEAALEVFGPGCELIVVIVRSVSERAEPLVAPPLNPQMTTGML